MSSCPLSRASSTSNAASSVTNSVLPCALLTSRSRSSSAVREHARAHRSLEARRRGARAVGGQLEQRGRVAELLAPERDVALELSALQRVALPAREVAVLEPERRERRLHPPLRAPRRAPTARASGCCATTHRTRRGATRAGGRGPRRPAAPATRAAAGRASRSNGRRDSSRTSASASASRASSAASERSIDLDRDRVRVVDDLPRLAVHDVERRAQHFVARDDRRPARRCSAATSSGPRSRAVRGTL